MWSLERGLEKKKGRKREEEKGIEKRKKSKPHMGRKGEKGD